MTQATAEQVRKYYKDQGLVVRISKDDGHVTYRYPDAINWSEGRYVSEYRIIDGRAILT